jgi:hypothetical protein
MAFDEFGKSGNDPADDLDSLAAAKLPAAA